MGVLQTFDRSAREILNDILIIRYFEYLKMDVLELAVYCDCQEFVSLPIVQNVINDIWSGKKFDKRDLVI